MMTEQDYIKSLQADAAHLSRSYDLLFETHQREIKRLEAERDAVAEDSARVCARMRAYTQQALTDIDRFLPEIRNRGQDLAALALRVVSDSLRAALAPEEPPE